MTWLLTARSFLDFLGVRGGIAVALGLALAIVMWRADSLSEQRDKAKAALVTEQAKHAVTRASVAALADKLEGFVEDGQLRKEARDKALEEVAEETARLREAAEAFDIETVEGL